MHQIVLFFFSYFLLEQKDSIIKSLVGVWKEEHIFELEQSFMLYHVYHEKKRECDLQIEKHLREKSGINRKEEERIKVRSNKNNLNFDAKEILQSITGTDLSEIFGITETNAVELISEVGINMEK